jgi:hypothetical protein
VWFALQGFEHLLENLGLGRLVFEKSHNLSLHKVNGSFREVHDSLRLHWHGHDHHDQSPDASRRHRRQATGTYRGSRRHTGARRFPNPASCVRRPELQGRGTSASGTGLGSGRPLSDSRPDTTFPFLAMSTPAVGPGDMYEQRKHTPSATSVKHATAALVPHTRARLNNVRTVWPT